MKNLPKIGLDVGSAAIKLVELAPSGVGKWRLLSAGAVPVPAGGWIDSPSSQTAVANAIIKLVKEAGVRSRRVVTALPEEQISTHVLEMPIMADSEIEQALTWQVEQYIPIPVDQAVWSYQVISRSEGGLEVLLAAASRTLVDGYRKVVEMAGLEVIAVETELMATARAIVPATATATVIVDVGARSTDVGIVAGGQLVFARTVPTAGEAFTRAIESVLGMDTAQAEQFKTAYGFAEGYMGGKLFAAMKPVLAIIATEVKKTIDFYVSKHANEVVKSVDLSGGAAALPEIVKMLSDMLGLEVVIGDPFARVEMGEGQKKTLAPTAAFYSVAVGLAMREG